MKSPEIYPPRKYPIPNQYGIMIITQQDPNLPPHLSKGPTEHKPFIYDTYLSNPPERTHTDTTNT